MKIPLVGGAAVGGGGRDVACDGSPHQVGTILEVVALGDVQGKSGEDQLRVYLRRGVESDVVEADIGSPLSKKRSSVVVSLVVRLLSCCAFNGIRRCKAIAHIAARGRRQRRKPQRAESFVQADVQVGNSLVRDRASAPRFRLPARCWPERTRSIGAKQRSVVSRRQRQCTMGRRERDA